MVPPKRFVVYVLLLVAIGASWLAGEGGVAPGIFGNQPGIFQVPTNPADVELLPPLNVEDEAVRKSRRPGDSFADDLNKLSTEEGDGSASNPAPVAPSMTATPNASPSARDEEPADEGSSRDDVRNIFSELEPEEGSKVTDPLGGVVIRSPLLATTPLPTPTDQRVWAGGQARGYTMLYAMQPEARPVVEVHVQTLLGARIRQLYIGVLIDGTFSRDFTYLKDVIARLTSEDHSLTLVLYMSNGPTMRKWRETPIDELFSRIDPLDFRQRIRREQQLRLQFLGVTLQAKDLFEFNRSLSSKNSNIAIVMLEDNLDVLAYRSMREIAAEQLGTIASFMRNPCVGCYDGNDDDTIGDAREEHALDRFNLLKRGDGYSLDGVGFQYPTLEGAGISSERALELVKSAYDKELRFFGLWRHDWQGVVDGVPNKLPSQRVYIPSTPDQQEFEIRMLRTGLVLESDSKE